MMVLNAREPHIDEAGLMEERKGFRSLVLMGMNVLFHGNYISCYRP